MNYRYSRRRNNRRTKRKSIRRTKKSRRRTNNSYRRRSTKQRRRTVRPYRRRVRTRRNKRSKRRVISKKQYGGRNEYDVLCGTTVEFLPSSSIILSGPDIQTSYWQEMVSRGEIGNYNIGKGYEPERIINGVERGVVNSEIMEEHKLERDELLSSIGKMAPISLDRFKDIIKLRLDVYTSQEKNIHHLGFWDNYIKGGMIDPDFSKVSMKYGELSVDVNPGFRPILDGKILITEKKEKGLPLINILKNIMYIDARIKEFCKYVILENSRANNVRKPDSREWYVEKINSKFQEYKESKITPPKMGKVYKDVDWFKVCCGLESYDEEYEKNVINRLLPGDISGKGIEDVKELKEVAMEQLKGDQEKIKAQIKVQELALKNLENSSVEETKDDLNKGGISDSYINQVDSTDPEAKEKLSNEISENIKQLNEELSRPVGTPAPTPDPTATSEPTPEPTPDPIPPSVSEPTPASPPVPPPPGPLNAASEPLPPPPAPPGDTPPPPSASEPLPPPLSPPGDTTPPPPPQPPINNQQQPPAPILPPLAQMGGAMTSACMQIVNEIKEGGKITESQLLRAIREQHGGNECFIQPSYLIIN